MPAPGSNIRAALATPQPFNLGTLTVNDVQRVEGTVVETYPDSLGVWVKWLHPKVGGKYDANRLQFYLQRGSIAQLEQLRVSGKQTALLVVVSGAMLAGLFSLVSLAVGQNSPTPTDGGGTAAQLGH
jgi:hypothetical protein